MSSGKEMFGNRIDLPKRINYCSMAIGPYSVPEWSSVPIGPSEPGARLYPDLPWAVELDLRQAQGPHPTQSVPQAAPIPQPDNYFAHKLHGAAAPSLAPGRVADTAPVARLYPDLPWAVELELRQDNISQAPPIDIPWRKTAEAESEVELPSSPPASLAPWTEPARPSRVAERGKQTPLWPSERSIA
jgi:hypothetical protein